VELPVLVLDAQATAASPSRGALLEIGWARWPAGDAPEPTAAVVSAHVVAPPPGLALPPAVARVTGLGPSEWARGIDPGAAWEHLREAARRVAPEPVPVVVHFARFEEGFLRALHERHGAGRFPFRLVCTHAIACRLLPELPRRTLRALAGYFGAGVSPLRRSADHVIATAFVWRHLAALLAEREGIAGLDALGEWLARPAPRSPRLFPLPLERRRQLPDRPGVYRFLRAGGAVLYVGKAASLRQRVRGHFHAPGGERALEMLTQVRDVSWSETETALEAALLEADEIKGLAPPYNVALVEAGRSVGFATTELEDLRERPDADHTVGPLVSPALVEAFLAVRSVLVDGPSRLPSLARRSCAVGAPPAYGPGPECFADGVESFVREHGSGASTRGLLRLGARLWVEAATGPRDGDSPEQPPGGRGPDWDAERVRRAMEQSVARAAHAVRRARWLVRLGECSLAWAEAGATERRLLVIEGGTVAARAHLPPGLGVPVPPGHARTAAERRAAFDLAAFDRLRVLTTELRALAAGTGTVELRLGPTTRLSRERLRAVLRWV